MRFHSYGILKHPDLETVVEGLRVSVRRGVFNPDPGATFSTTLLLRNMPEVQGARVLDLGCGSGIIAITCALRGAKQVIASDINDKALANTRENIEHHKVTDRVDIVRSDLFSKIDGQFDFIFANLPIGEHSWNMKESTTELIARFLREAPAHLEAKGHAFFTWCSATPVTPVRNLILRSDFIADERVKKYRSRTWYLFDLTHN